MATVTYDAAGTATTNLEGPTWTWQHTFGSNANCLVVGLMVYSPGYTANPLDTSRTLTVGGKTMVFKGGYALFPAVVVEGWTEIWSLQGEDIVGFRGTTQTLNLELRSIAAPLSVWPKSVTGNSLSYNNVESVSQGYFSRNSGVTIASAAIPSRVCDVAVGAVGGSAYYAWTGTLRHPVKSPDGPNSPTNLKSAYGVLIQDTQGTGGNVVLGVNRWTWGASSTAALNLLGSPIVDPPVIVTTQLDTIVKGTSTLQQLSTASNSSLVTWTLVSGSLPTGLAFTSAGLISGTPTTFGDYQFAMRATAAGLSSERTFSGTVLKDYLPFLDNNTVNIKYRLGGFYYPVRKMVKVSNSFKKFIARN
jgi:hypothetical protein